MQQNELHAFIVFVSKTDKGINHSNFVLYEHDNDLCVSASGQFCSSDEAAYLETQTLAEEYCAAYTARQHKKGNIGFRVEVIPLRVSGGGLRRIESLREKMRKDSDTIRAKLAKWQGQEPVTAQESWALQVQIKDGRTFFFRKFSKDGDVECCIDLSRAKTYKRKSTFDKVIARLDPALNPSLVKVDNPRQ